MLKYHVVPEIVRQISFSNIFFKFCEWC